MTGRLWPVTALHMIVVGPMRAIDPLRSLRYLNSCRSNLRKRTAHLEEGQAAHARVPQESRQRDAPSRTIAASFRLTWRCNPVVISGAFGLPLRPSVRPTERATCWPRTDPQSTVFPGWSLWPRRRPPMSPHDPLLAVANVCFLVPNRGCERVISYRC